VESQLQALAGIMLRCIPAYGLLEKLTIPGLGAVRCGIGQGTKRN